MKKYRVQNQASFQPASTRGHTNVIVLVFIWWSFGLFIHSPLEAAETKTSIILKGLGILLSKNRQPPTQKPAVEKTDPTAIANLLAMTKLENEALDGNVNAQVKLGKIYAGVAGGYGIKHDDKESFKWFLLAAKQGHAEAEFCIGYMYGVGRGTAKNETEAIKWILKSAETGNVDAQFFMALSYMKGAGVPISDTEAAKWLQKASSQGHAEAQLCLAIALSNGSGVIQNAEESIKWLIQSAQNGNAEAQYALGLHYMDGVNISKDPAEAFKWVQKSAVRGNAEAQRLLASFYTLGLGVREDQVEAYKWMLISGPNESPTTKESFELIERLLTPEQREIGLKRAKEFRSQ